MLRALFGPQHPRFVFATGIENSCPVIALPDGSTRRVDEMERCGHYARWREDFELAREVGVTHLRYGPAYYRVHRAPGHYDWEFADETFAALASLGLAPIADLCHFGLPDWIGDFQNPDWPALFAEYAGAFARRFPHVRLYTPVNEIFIAATFSAQLGWWNERLASDRAFVNALKHLCRANILAMRAVLEAQPDAAFVQSESSEYFHAADPDAETFAHFLNDKRFLALDLTYGYPLSALMYEYLMDNGMSRDEYHWFRRHQVAARCIMGTDYYVTNEHLVRGDHSIAPSGEIFGYYAITRQYFERYHLPVMHTETNIHDSEAGPQWLRKQWANVRRLKQDGIPTLGFTWYSLTDQIDWDSALRNYEGVVNPCGLFDLDRRARPVGREYTHLIAEWRQRVDGDAVSPAIV